MPTQAYPGLMSERSVANWLWSYPSSAVDQHLRALLEQVADLGPKGLDVAVEADGLQDEVALDAEEHLLLLVGTVLVRNGQRQLWNKIYDVVTKTRGEGDCFLTTKTAAARRGAF